MRCKEGTVLTRRGIPSRKSGVTAYNAMLNPHKVRRIREFAAMEAPYRAIGRLYGVSEGCIGCVVRRDTWKHVA